MAAPYTVRLINGPCSGQRKTLTPDEFAAGETTCKGAVYVYDGVTRPSGQLPHFTYRPGAPPPPSTGGNLTAPRAHGGWQDLRRSINHKLPRSLNRAGSLTRAALRATSGGRRVKL